MLFSIGRLACLGCVCRPAEQTGRWGAECSIPVPYFVWSGELSACSAPASAAEKRRSEAVFDGFLPVGLRRAPRCKTCGCAGEPVLQPKRAGRAFQHFRKAAASASSPPKCTSPSG